MNRIDLTQPGKLPLTQDLLNFLQDAYSSPMAAIAGMVAGSGLAVVEGCIVAGGSQGPGWISYNKELLPMAAGVIQSNIEIVEVASDLIYQDGIARPVKKVRYAQFSATGTIAWGTPFRISGSLLDLIAQTNTRSIATENALSAHESANPSHDWATIANRPFLSGNYVVGDVGGVAPGVGANLSSSDSIVTITHNAGWANYRVFVTAVSHGANVDNDNDVMLVIRDKTTNSFKVALREVAANVQSISIDYLMFKY